MRGIRSLALALLLCLGTVSLIGLMDFYQPGLASCDPPPDPPKPPKK